jgi:hypothetical protein
MSEENPTAEVRKSQIPPDDLRALRSTRAVLCPVEYCKGGYVNEPDPVPPDPPDDKVLG